MGNIGTLWSRLPRALPAPVPHPALQLHTLISNFLKIPLVITLLAGCSFLPASVAPTLPPPAISTPLQVCPEASEGTLALRNDPMGYCLLYPDDLYVVEPFDTEICLVPELPSMMCHSNRMQIEVSDAAGMSASELADQAIAQAQIEIARSTTMLAGEEAVVLDGVPAQDLLRDVYIVHEGRLYKLRFVLPDPSDISAVDRFSVLYSTVIDSFTFLPPTQ